MNKLKLKSDDKTSQNLEDREYPLGDIGELLLPTWKVGWLSFFIVVLSQIVITFNSPVSQFLIGLNIIDLYGFIVPGHLEHLKELYEGEEDQNELLASVLARLIGVLLGGMMLFNSVNPASIKVEKYLMKHKEVSTQKIIMYLLFWAGFVLFLIISYSIDGQVGKVGAVESNWLGRCYPGIATFLSIQSLPKFFFFYQYLKQRV